MYVNMFANFQFLFERSHITNDFSDAVPSSELGSALVQFLCCKHVTVLCARAADLFL